jgi:hypothetical protein
MLAFGRANIINRPKNDLFETGFAAVCTYFVFVQQPSGIITSSMSSLLGEIMLL